MADLFFLIGATAIGVSLYMMGRNLERSNKLLRESIDRYFEEMKSPE